MMIAILIAIIFIKVTIVVFFKYDLAGRLHLLDPLIDLVWPDLDTGTDLATENDLDMVVDLDNDLVRSPSIPPNYDLAQWLTWWNRERQRDDLTGRLNNTNDLVDGTDLAVGLDLDTDNDLDNGSTASEYEVLAITDVQHLPNGVWFLVTWLVGGFTWESAENLHNCWEILDSFLDHHTVIHEGIVYEVKELLMVYGGQTNLPHRQKRARCLACSYTGLKQNVIRHINSNHSNIVLPQ